MMDIKNFTNWERARKWAGGVITVPIGQFKFYMLFILFFFSMMDIKIFINGGGGGREAVGFFFTHYYIISLI